MVETQEIILHSGETLTAAELAEGFALLAESQSVWPLLTPADRLKARIALAFELAALADELALGREEGL
jgi:hypothetical protein